MKPDRSWGRLLRRCYAMSQAALAQWKQWPGLGASAALSAPPPTERTELVFYSVRCRAWSRGEPLPSRLLKNYLRGLCGVKNGLKMLLYSSKLRFFGHFSLA